MPAAPQAPPPDDGTSYIRAAGAVKVDAGRLVRGLVVAGLVVLVVVAIALTVGAASQNTRLDKLRHHGVPVQARVTGCLGISSGIGMAIEYWECRGTYTLGGHSYTEVIGGSRTHLLDGQTLPAIAVPGDPTLLSTVASVARKSSSWTPYVTPIILGVIVVVVILGWVWWSKRHQRRDGAGAGAGA
jgi:protein-S-isoprenylcysteine O-methyltransferase Ste14